MEFAEMMKDFGPVIGIILFFIWRDWKREDKLVERVQALEEYQQQTLVSLVRENITVIASNTESMRWAGEQLHKCHEHCTQQAGHKDG